MFCNRVNVRCQVKEIVKKTFRLTGLRVQRDLPELWDNAEDFQLLFKEIKGHTVVHKDRCFMLYQLAACAGLKEGEIAEVGIYKGGTGKLIAKTRPDKKVHLFDTFTETPTEDPNIDFQKEGGVSDTSLESVQKFLSDCDNVTIYPGFFPRTAEPLKDKSFCFVHIDVSLYKSIKDSLEFFYDKIVPGGIMVIEGYEWRACPGAKKAINEFLADKPEMPIITTRWQCMLVKNNSA